jgi:hypothetical protein
MAGGSWMADGRVKGTGRTHHFIFEWGKQGVQIGGSGNVQNVTLTLEKLNNYIDSAGATTQEKAEAKSLLKAALENPLVQMAIKWWTGAPS